RALHSSRSQGSGTCAIGSIASVRSAASESDSRSLSREVYLRRLFRCRRRLEQRVVLEPEQLCREVRGELTPGGVVLLHALVVPHPFDGDAILRSRELVHQAVELLVGFQLRVVFDDREQATEGGGLLVGSLNPF